MSCPLYADRFKESLHVHQDSLGVQSFNAATITYFARRPCPLHKTWLYYLTFEASFTKVRRRTVTSSSTSHRTMNTQFHMTRNKESAWKTHAHYVVPIIFLRAKQNFIDIGLEPRNERSQPLITTVKLDALEDVQTPDSLQWRLWFTTMKYKELISHPFQFPINQYDFVFGIYRSL